MHNRLGSSLYMSLMTFISKCILRDCEMKEVTDGTADCSYTVSAVHVSDVRVIRLMTVQAEILQISWQ